jgi:tetratricopeptide (TPR) repeat protein
VIANRYAYFAAAPFCFLFGAAILGAWARPRAVGKTWTLPAFVVPASLALVAFAAGTALHVKDWRDAETVWRRTLEVSPGHALAHNEMGLALMEKKDFPGALASFKRAIELAPRFSEVMCNMGGAYVSMNDTTNAEKILRRALAVSPDDYAVITNLGNVRMIEKRYAEAAEFYSASLARNPSAFVTSYNLGYARMLLGSPAEALVYLRRTVALNPNYREAYFLEGEILSKHKETADEALGAYVHAARLGHEQSQRILAERGLEW